MEKFTGLLFAFLVTGTVALEDFNKFREGSCAGIQMKPVAGSREFIDTLKYVPAGSKYHFYRMASALPNYKEIRDDEFYYDFCYGINTTTTDPIGAGFGFGQLLSTFKISTSPGLYLEATSTDPSESWDVLRQTVTLTDNKSFAFIVNCRMGSDQVGWDVHTLTPNLDVHTQREIEEHAVGLGFKRENFVFLRYDSCRWGGPVFDGWWRRKHQVAEVFPLQGFNGLGHSAL